MNNLEIEVKFYLDAPDRTHQSIVDLGASPQPKVFETNLRFDNQDQDLLTNHQLLRLRQDNTCRLTFKSKPPQLHSQCKVYRELEVEVSDFDTMQDILAQLGYHQAQTYEKWRQTYRWRDTELCMDTMPYGAFLEIEGPEESIKKVAGRLRLPWEKRILENYLGMFESLRRYYQLPFGDVTFTNFDKYPVDITPLLERFEAGKP